MRCFANGEYGEGEIRSGDLGVAFYGPSFGGPYAARIHVAGGPSAWEGALSGRTPGMRVSAAASFPVCRTTFEHDALPVQVSLEVVSPWVPGDSRLCSLPALFFDFRIHNPGTVEQQATVVLPVPNPDADNPRPLHDGGRLTGLLLDSKRAGGGTLCGMVVDDGASRTSWGGALADGVPDGTPGNLLGSSIAIPPGETRHVVFVFAW